MQLKSTPYAVKSIEGRTVVGVPSVFGNVDDGSDRIWPGSFTKTIQERRSHFRHLWNHAFWDPPIATIDNIREIGREDLPPAVLEKAPNAVGGLEVTRTYLDTPRADEVLKGIIAGAINEMSFGYDVIPGKMALTDEAERVVREIYEVRLWDTSDVNWGMNEATTAAKLNIPFDIPLELLAKWLEQTGMQLKSGARHSAADVKLLNAIHAAAVDLGATQCKGIADENEEAQDEEGKSRAGALVPLTLLKSRLDSLQIAVLST